MKCPEAGTAIFLAITYGMANMAILDISRSAAMITVTSVEAQTRFGELIDRSQREPVAITRRGRTVAYVVSEHEMRLVSGQTSKPPAGAKVSDLLAMPGGEDVDFEIPDERSELRRSREEATQWYASYRQQVATQPVEATPKLTEADVNRLVHELR
jgi:prevent-host-death family protein